MMAIMRAACSRTHVPLRNDMLVLNAGVFPGGARIAEIGAEQWRIVMRVNLDANVILLRGCPTRATVRSSRSAPDGRSGSPGRRNSRTG
jgi:NAD(P)-dependent dehydrogenase (short-subunit alcohol dehydrogenase family)